MGAVSRSLDGGCLGRAEHQHRLDDWVFVLGGTIDVAIGRRGEREGRGGGGRGEKREREREGGGGGRKGGRKEGKE